MDTLEDPHILRTGWAALQYTALQARPPRRCVRHHDRLYRPASRAVFRTPLHAVFPISAARACH